MLIEDFNRTIDTWINELEKYDLNQLLIKPSPNSWSLGQVYIHLITDTKFYADQIRICISNNNNVDEEASPFAKTMFLNNQFPDQMIEGAPSNSSLPQPDSKLQLLRSLMNLKGEMNEVGKLITQSIFKGKTKHPGLNYFNATEWLQLTEMHFRHHLRQKKRIDDFLNHNLNSYPVDK